MNTIRITWIVWLACVFAANTTQAQDESLAPAGKQHKQIIKAIYIPLADHYAGIVAYEKYRDQMKYADYQILQMKSWPLLRSYFMSGEADMAYIICPMAMDMFREKPNFRWVSLMHRDGNALAINDILNTDVNLPADRADRKPDEQLAQALMHAKDKLGHPIECGVPHLLSTHTVVLYKYLKEHGLTLALGQGTHKDMVAIEVSPAKSPSFIKKNSSRSIPATFEQSLPWADVVETHDFGKVAWYSKDVMPWPNGHVECIAIATDDCIEYKQKALKEVIYYIHKAGLDIEAARTQGGSAMQVIADMIRKHIPEHNQEAIIQSLRPDLMVINYMNLNLDLPGLKQIMDYAIEGGILKESININLFADTQFSTQITEISGIPDKPSAAMQTIMAKEIAVISQWAADPIIVAGVKEQNAKGKSLRRIKVIDRQWINGGRNEFAQRLLNNKIGSFLMDKISSKKQLYTEAFLCDAHGSIVGEYPKTLDYWQGEKDIFTKSISGTVFVSPIFLDVSTNCYSIQVSVPVMDHETAIGVLVVGLRNLESPAILRDEKWTMSED